MIRAAGKDPDKNGHLHSFKPPSVMLGNNQGKEGVLREFSTKPRDLRKTFDFTWEDAAKKLL